MIYIECNLCDIDELSLGIFMNYGEDEKGDFHMTTLGFLILEINIIKYGKIDDNGNDGISFM
jgi:hypothetical protein